MSRALGILALVVGGLSGCGHAPIPPAEDPELQAKHRMHTVKAGETLYGIGRTYRVSPSAIATLNRMRDPNRLRPGDRLLIPGPKPSEPPPPPPPPPKVPLSPPPPRTSKTCRAVGDVPVPTEVSKAGLSWPLDGVVITRYGRRDGLPYEGIDIAAPTGTPILAAASGTVLFAGEQGGFGRLVIVRHSTRRVTIYAHNLENCVRRGTKVRRGQVIALVGQSGGTASPYVYFEVREGNAPVNPRHRLPP